MNITLFNFKGTPVSVKPLFFLLFFLMKPSMVLIIFLSVLIHELAHTIVAKRLGYMVHSIYIDLLNGSANIELDKATPLDSIKIVSAGPLSNFFIFILSLSVNFILTHFYGIYDTPYIRDIELMNLAFFGFNLIPIFPMDGGRIFRDILLLIGVGKIKVIKIGSVVSIILSILLGIVSYIISAWLLFGLSIFFIIISIVQFDVR